MPRDQRNSREFRSSGRVNGCMSFLRNLERDQILELLSEGFCGHCEARLEDRLHAFISENGCGDSFEGSADGASGLEAVSPFLDDELPEDRNESIKISQVGWKNDFSQNEVIKGRLTNVVEGLELFTRVFSFEQQKKIVDFVYNLQDMGKNGLLRGRTYTEPRKWMRGKGRVTIQFGCCYNYAEDKQGNPPGIIRHEEVEPVPLLFKQMIKKMVRWGIMPENCVPDSCIVNIYEEGDCIPPHIDHHDFVAPFCTVSLLSECNILFGSEIEIVGAGDFRGSLPIRLPVGSVLIFNGNGADIAKHCISAVSEKRISITFRKMDNKKLPYNFQHDPEMQRIKAIDYSPKIRSRVPPHLPQNQYHEDNNKRFAKKSKMVRKRLDDEMFHVERNDFPPHRRFRANGSEWRAAPKMDVGFFVSTIHLCVQKSYPGFVTND